MLNQSMIPGKDVAHDNPLQCKHSLAMPAKTAIPIANKAGIILPEKHEIELQRVLIIHNIERSLSIIQTLPTQLAVALDKNWRLSNNYSVEIIRSFRANGKEQNYRHKKNQAEKQKNGSGILIMQTSKDILLW